MSLIMSAATRQVCRESLFKRSECCGEYFNKSLIVVERKYRHRQQQVTRGQNLPNATLSHGLEYPRVSIPIMFLHTSELAWIPNTELTPLDVESENTKSPVEKGKSITLLAAYGKAADTNDLAHSMAMLADHQKAIEIGEEINEEKAANKTTIVLIIALVACSGFETTVQDQALHFQLGLFQGKPHHRYHFGLLAAVTQRRRVQWGGKCLANSEHFYQLQGGMSGLRDWFCTSSAAESADGK